MNEEEKKNMSMAIDQSRSQTLAIPLKKLFIMTLKEIAYEFECVQLAN